MFYYFWKWVSNELNEYWYILVKQIDYFVSENSADNSWSFSKDPHSVLRPWIHRASLVWIVFFHSPMPDGHPLIHKNWEHTSCSLCSFLPWNNLPPLGPTYTHTRHGCCVPCLPIRAFVQLCSGFLVASLFFLNAGYSLLVVTLCPQLLVQCVHK